MRVIVCHQMPVVRSGLSAQLRACGIEDVECTDSGLHVLRLVADGNVDVVLTGTALRGVGLGELLERLRQESVTCPTVVHAVPADDAVVAELVMAGARGLLSDDVDETELAAALVAVAAGGVALSPEIAGLLVDSYRALPRTPAPIVDEALGRRLEVLTGREREVLLCTARGMTAREIAAHFVIGEATVRTHVYRLRMKLACSDRAQLVGLAYRAGLMTVAGPVAPPVVRAPRAVPDVVVPRTVRELRPVRRPPRRPAV